MDTIFAIRGDDWVILAADCSAQFSIVRLKDDEDKLVQIDSSKVLATAGDTASR